MPTEILARVKAQVAISTHWVTTEKTSAAEKSLRPKRDVCRSQAIGTTIELASQNAFPPTFLDSELVDLEGGEGGGGDEEGEEMMNQFFSL